MTMKPKARKFRIRKTGGASTTGPAEAGAAQAADMARSDTPGPSPRSEVAAAGQVAMKHPGPAATEDGFGTTPFPGSAAHDRLEAESAGRESAQQAEDAGAAQAPPPASPPSGGTPTAEQELAAIRAEGLTGRQLRMARRIAQKHGLAPSSDFDAVRLLRHRGIDPFARGGKLELVVDTGTQPSAAPAGTQSQSTGQALAPMSRQTTPAVPQPVGVPQPLGADERAAEIMKVQRDIARRRRKRLILLATRLSFFVLLPTLLVAFYFYRVATPMYATHTEFIIQKAESGASSGGGGLGGLLGGSGFATVQESITVQAFLESREAMLRLEDELGFREHFSQEAIDPLNRIGPDATDEDVYDTYLRHLRIGYDPTEGLIRMEVIAADPEVSQSYSQALIGFAEERVDRMSQRLRADQMSGARENFEDAEARALEAQQRVLNLQEQRGVLSTEAEVSTVFGQIQNFELQLQEERLRLAELLSVPQPNASRVEVAERNIARLEALITDLRSSLTNTGTGEISLARIQSELIIAQADLETRQMILAQALQQMESARIEANRQTLYLSVGVFPIAPDAPAYPRAFENTLLAFLVFSGIYLLISMTVSILREQVSS
ncbi:MAG: capsular polysaccharide transport system permease protein [Rhodobacteraceae bacterium HLUCCO18]|nr:MAG: capsular polysaccharide transport system permease protein [Rhodobacteraceae bacterium HLUCCO18]